MDDDMSSKVSKSLNKRKGKQIEGSLTKEESLMDHLKKIENGDVSTTIEMDSSSDESVCRVENVDVPISNEALISEANRIAKENLLNSSDSNGK